MWGKTLNNKIATFDSVKKIVQMNHWCKEYINKNFDIILVDEAQDFDDIMLKILLDDVTIPRVFVGDPMQAIYGWRGAINSFDKLPSDTLNIEFYSTFRFSEEVCQNIRSEFTDCMIFSKSKNNTTLDYGLIPNSRHVHLFRTNRSMFVTAQQTPNVWIYDYKKIKNNMMEIYNKLRNNSSKNGEIKLTKDEQKEFGSDIPKYLLDMSIFDLNKLITDIEYNMVSEEECDCKLYTVHKYKGMEDDVVRLNSDIIEYKNKDYKNTQKANEEINVYYVALTRGKKQIYIDFYIPSDSDNIQYRAESYLRYKFGN